MKRDHKILLVFLCKVARMVLSLCLLVVFTRWFIMSGYMPTYPKTTDIENTITRSSGEVLLQDETSLEQVAVYADNYLLDYLISGQQVDDSQRQAFFQELIKKTNYTFNFHDFKSVRVVFNGDIPRKIILFDHYIGCDGYVRFNRVPSIRRTVRLKEGIGSYRLGWDDAIGLESIMEPLEPFNRTKERKSSCYRGFQMICKWKDHTMEYFFILPCYYQAAEVTTVPETTLP